MNDTPVPWEIILETFDWEMWTGYQKDDVESVTMRK